MTMKQVELDIQAGIARGLELMTGMSELVSHAPEDEILWTRTLKLESDLRALVEVRNAIGNNVRVHLMRGEAGLWSVIETLGPVASLWDEFTFTKRPYVLQIVSDEAPEYPVLKIRA